MPSIRPGQRFGRWTVIGKAGISSGRRQWECRCDCGAIKNVLDNSLASCSSVSCGCYQKEAARQQMTRHGEKVGGRFSPEIVAYDAAKKRCTNPDDSCFDNYGGRGIEFRFSSFKQFLSEIGRRPSAKHSLDRKDNSGHYEPGNVRWATPTEQAQNKRTNHVVTAGVSRCLSEWTRRLGVSKNTVGERLKRGWCESCAVRLPKRSRCHLFA